MHSSDQFAVRLVVLMMAALAGLSIWLDIDMLPGAFAAGVVYQVLASHAEIESRELVESKLEGSPPSPSTTTSCGRPPPPPWWAPA